MKTLTVNEFPNVMVPDYLQKILKEAKVKSFNLSMHGEDCHVELHVNMEKVATYTAGEKPVPETFAGNMHVVVIL